MLRQRLYYALKPYLPWSLRMGVRRIAAKRIRKTSREIWPIDESAAMAPLGWPGWPNGKEFALVLTHDIEGIGGPNRCRELAELEMGLGFRSSFNFVPEGSYLVPPDLRDWLTTNGFEVGVHDLEHNGKLFQSHSDFRAKASRINHYLREWRATGFRAGFMLRNLDWLHDLDIAYDASTFDTDPFEPQSDGARSIFPFWVPTPTQPSGKHATRLPGEIDPSRGQGTPESPFTRNGYVELPYTLTQDSTLFTVLQEGSIDLWKDKCRWIAANRGMAMLITHPDYMAFNGVRPKAWEYPVEMYESFLRHVSTSYSGEYWHALPRDVARYSYGVLSHPTARSPAKETR